MFTTSRESQLCLGQFLGWLRTHRRHVGNVPWTCPKLVLAAVVVEYNRIVVAAMVMEHNRIVMTAAAAVVVVVVVVVVESIRIVVVLVLVVVVVEYLEGLIFLHRSHPLEIL